MDNKQLSISIKKLLSEVKSENNSLLPRLPVGTIVKLSQSGKKDHEEDEDNPYNLKGKIIKVTPFNPKSSATTDREYLVKWSNGKKNAYAKYDLKQI